MHDGTSVRIRRQKSRELILEMLDEAKSGPIAQRALVAMSGRPPLLVINEFDEFGETLAIAVAIALAPLHKAVDVRD